MTSVAFHIDQLWFSAPGGIGTYVWELFPALQRADPSLDLVPFRSRWRHDPPRMWALAEPPVELPSSIRTLYPRWDLFAKPALPAALTACDIVHATNPAAIAPAPRGKKLVVTVHDLAFEHFPAMFPTTWRWLYRAGLKAAVKRADAIVTPSRATADDLLARTKVDPSRVHVTPLASSLDVGSDDPTRRLDRLGIASPYVAFVGTLEPRKNLPLLVRAYRRAVGEKLPHALVLAGPEGWRTTELDAEIAREGVGTVIRTGALSGDDLDAVYRGASAFVYPSRYEGFGLPVAEAMARGVPTIASDIPPIREVAGRAAFLVDPRSEDELAIAIERVLLDEPLAADLHRDGPAQVAHLSWDATARATLDVYRQVTAS